VSPCRKGGELTVLRRADSRGGMSGAAGMGGSSSMLHVWSHGCVHFPTRTSHSDFIRSIFIPLRVSPIHSEYLQSIRSISNPFGISAIRSEYVNTMAFHPIRSIRFRSEPGAVPYHSIHLLRFLSTWNSHFEVKTQYSSLVPNEERQL